MTILLIIGAVLILLIGAAIGFCLALAALDQQYRVEEKEFESERQKAIESSKRLELANRDLEWLIELYGDSLEEKSQTTTFAEVA